LHQLRSRARRLYQGGLGARFRGRHDGLADQLWLDTIATLGFMLELVEANPVTDMVFGKFREAATNWDGKFPVRSFG